MGYTLASFPEQAGVNAFIDDHGGKVIRYANIDLPLLGELRRGELISEAP